jgi:Family of unknown function (DUF5995)
VILNFISISCFDQFVLTYASKIFPFKYLLMNLPATIDGVLEELDRIIELTVDDDNYLAFFAIVYRDTTARIKSKIESGAFDDNARMQDMDVRFANLYIRAYYDYQAGKEVSKSWRVPFEAARKRLAIVQHIMLGMNAHINLDLAIAAASVMEGKPIEILADDFRLVNEILAGLTNEMQDQLASVSPLMFLLDWIGQRSDEKIIDFSIKIAREQSWHIAQEIWALQGEEQEARIEKVDKSIEQIALRIKSPGTTLLRLALRIISAFEPKGAKVAVTRMRE